MRVKLSVEHGIQLLLQALTDFFIEVILAVQMVKHQIDEQLIGYLYAFIRFFPFLSGTVVTIVTVFLIPPLLSF